MSVKASKCFLFLIILLNIESETEGHGRCCRRCYPCAVGQRCFYCTFLITFALLPPRARVYGTPFKEQFVDMLRNTKENLEANSSFYLEQELVELFQNTTLGLTEDCEGCKNYPSLSSIANFTRQVSSLLGSMEESNDQNFTAVALEKVQETIQLFEEVPKNVTVLDGRDGCPHTWQRSQETNGKCYKAYREEFSWSELSQDNPNFSSDTQGCPDDSRVAIVDSIPRSSAVVSALRVAGLKNCWVYGSQWPPELSSSTAFWWFSSKNDIPPFKVEDNFVDNECLNNELLGSCLYTNENGKGCNDVCDAKRCFVCEINPVTSIQPTTATTPISTRSGISIVKRWSKSKLLS